MQTNLKKEEDTPETSHIQQPSLMVRKFLSGETFEPPTGHDKIDVFFHPTYFFFYGSLMDMKQLGRVLRLQNTPVLSPATIIGWEVKMWGPYPALVHKPNSIVHGIACEVQTEQQVEMLKHYETDNYKLRGSKVKFLDGREVSGKVFVWNSDTALLTEGVFDLKDWQMQQIDPLMDED